MSVTATKDDQREGEVYEGKGLFCGSAQAMGGEKYASCLPRATPSGRESRGVRGDYADARSARLLLLHHLQASVGRDGATENSKIVSSVQHVTNRHFPVETPPPHGHT